MNNHKLILSLALALSWLSIFITAPQTHAQSPPPPRAKISAFPAQPPDTHMRAEMLHSDFESGEGFTLGSCAGQNGWSAYGDTSDQAQIDALSPSNGTQHVVINGGDAQSGNYYGCQSPFISGGAINQGSVYIDVKINAGEGLTVGADYAFFIYSDAANTPTAGIYLWHDGYIWTDDGTSNGRNSGTHWTAGEYGTLSIVLSEDGTLTYWYNGTQVDTRSVFAGESIVSVAMISNDFSVGDTGYFDNLRIYDKVSPVRLRSFKAQAPGIQIWLLGGALLAACGVCHIKKKHR